MLSGAAIEIRPLGTKDKLLTKSLNKQQMQNCKTSARTTIQQSSKCSLLFRSAVLAAILLLVAVLSSCKYECKKIDVNFRPHTVTHYHKSKVYHYYHHTPCSNCISVSDDLRRDSRNFVTYLDNNEVVR